MKSMNYRKKQYCTFFNISFLLFWTSVHFDKSDKNRFFLILHFYQGKFSFYSFYNISRNHFPFFYKFLWNGSTESKEALVYLKKRNFSQKTLLTFGIGYAPENRFFFFFFLLKKGYKKDRGATGFFSNSSFRGSYKKFGGK